MSSKLELYDLAEDKKEMLCQVFSNSTLQNPILEVYKQRPKPSVLRMRVLDHLSILDIYGNRHPPAVMQAVLRSIQRSWDSFGEGSVAPNEFMRTPFGAPYEIVAIEGKGRGIIASRDIRAGEAVLQDWPVLMFPPGEANILTFLTLPQKALEAILLLHNTKPAWKRFSLDDDIPVHRLLDLLQGVLDTNCFGDIGSYGQVGMLLLTGSLINHSETPNLMRALDGKTERMIFTSVRTIKKGEELEVNYVGDVFGAEKAEKLKNYGL
jgi:SET domain